MTSAGGIIAICLTVISLASLLFFVSGAEADKRDDDALYRAAQDDPRLAALLRERDA